MRFLHLLRHINLNSLIDKQVLNLLVLTEIIQPVRAHQHGINPILVDYLSNVVIQCIDIHVHKPLALDTVLVRDKTHQFKAHGLLRTDIIRHTHTASQCPVNKHPLGTRV